MVERLNAPLPAPPSWNVSLPVPSTLPTMSKVGAIVKMLPGVLPDMSTAVPPVPTIVPESKMLTAPEADTSKPRTAEIIPVLVMPPAKVETLTTASPLVPAEMVPLLVMPPENAEIAWANMPHCIAVIVPLLVIPPENVEIVKAYMPLACADEIVPLLVMPPENVETLLAKAPEKWASIVPLLVKPPAKVEMLKILTP